ncbi:hypothetical protein [Bizionia paragorgiae]|uniref:hypothetical protein n=1 Tax=Bizionia paragorgiae TaxID=283786 RepID=UPI003A93D48F
MKHSINLSLICLVLLTSCTYFQNKKAEKQMQDYTAYKDLHQHQGTDNYEVITLLNTNTNLEEKLIDKKQLILSIIGTKGSLDNVKFNRLKIDFFGNIHAQGLVYETLKDGTMWHKEGYNNWLINGDDTKLQYLDPLTEKDEKNWENYTAKFNILYKEASYVYKKVSNYYFKIDDQWYKVKDSFTPKERPKDFRSQYPEKIDPEEIRMQPLQESMEALMKQNIIKVIDYVQMDSEQGIGLNPINFSSGYYMLELYLPQGDTLKFRRYGAMGVSSELFVYQIPEALGGSKEVFFIEQEPNSLYPDQSFAGFYAIRPKNYKQLPEYRPLLEKEKQKQLKSRRLFLSNEK